MKQHVRKGIAFSGQQLSVWLERPEDRERLLEVIARKYMGQLSLSSYAKLALQKELARDEAELSNEEDKEGQGLPSVTSQQGETTRPQPRQPQHTPHHRHNRSSVDYQ